MSIENLPRRRSLRIFSAVHLSIPRVPAPCKFLGCGGGGSGGSFARVPERRLLMRTCNVFHRMPIYTPLPPPDHRPNTPLYKSRSVDFFFIFTFWNMTIPMVILRALLSSGEPRGRMLIANADIRTRWKYHHLNTLYYCFVNNIIIICGTKKDFFFMCIYI